VFSALFFATAVLFVSAPLTCFFNPPSPSRPAVVAYNNVNGVSCSGSMPPPLRILCLLRRRELASPFRFSFLLNYIPYCWCLYFMDVCRGLFVRLPTCPCWLPFFHFFDKHSACSTECRNSFPRSLLTVLFSCCATHYLFPRIPGAGSDNPLLIPTAGDGAWVFAFVCQAVLELAHLPLSRIGGYHANGFHFTPPQCLLRGRELPDANCPFSPPVFP